MRVIRWALGVAAEEDRRAIESIGGHGITLDSLHLYTDAELMRLENVGPRRVKRLRMLQPMHPPPSHI